VSEPARDPIPEFPFRHGPGGAPPPEYAELRATCPVSQVRTPAGDVAYLAVGAADVRAVYEDRRLSRNLRRDGAPRMLPGADLSTDPDTMMNLDPPEHTRLRRLTAAAFTPKRAETWRPLAEQTASDFVDSLTACGRGSDLMRLVAFPLPVRIICRIMGVPEDDAPAIRAWSDTMLSVSSADGEQRAGAAREFGKYIAELIDWYRGHGAAGTLLADLIAARDDDGDRLSQEELVSTVLTLILAGHETTANVIGRGVLALLSSPGAWGRLGRDPGLVPAAVEEILRLEVPGHGGMLRLATEDVELPSGAVIPAGQAVVAPTVCANHDPDLFPDPLTLDLDRDASGHLTFGAGVHYCLGAHLARVELQATFGMLTARLPTLALAAGVDAVEWTAASKVCGPLELPVSW
jgi:cytochrome P450